MADDLGEEWWKDEADRKESEPSENEQPPGEDRQDDGPPKKKRKRHRKRITDELKEKGDNPSSPEDVIAFLTKQFEGKLSAVERDEISLDPEANFCKANTSPEFGVAYLRQVLPKWKKLKAGVEGHGSPVLLVICPSALRAVDLNRKLQEFKGEKCKCVKLFAKHMKLEEQQKFLKKSTCHMGIGTPSRILALIKSGHLGLDQLCAVVIDWNWRDVKHHRLVDAPELRTELANLLKTYIIPHIKSHSKCKIGIL
ncbi:uncharacterized protein C3orf26 homolog [Mya arenaria]|uniref:uncharacterized protein C3orf26 homolog n=1 Tax=Mya arenaria TaxID=6604 RepID=UPI0022E6DEF9|nr:uncharacterized protein C3orf26 homolog [Mya arenaria]